TAYSGRGAVPKARSRASSARYDVAEWCGAGPDRSDAVPHPGHKLRSIAGEFPEIHPGGETAEDVAVLVGRHTLRHRHLRVDLRNKGCHLAVPDAADADALVK